MLFVLLFIFNPALIGSPPESRLTIVQFGDSHLGTPAGKSLGAEIASRTNSQVAYMPSFKNGTQMRHLTAALKGESPNFSIRVAKSVQPKVVILSFGTNEAMRLVQPLEIAKETLACINAARALFPQAQILLTGPPDSRAPSLTNVILGQRMAANAARIAYIDVAKLMGGRGSNLSWMHASLAKKDGIHFTESGYRRLNANIAPHVVRYL